MIYQAFALPGLALPATLTLWNDSNELNTKNTVLQLLFSTAVNTSISCYYLSKERIRHLNYLEIFKLSFRVTNPVIPALSVALTALALTTLALNFFNKKSVTWLKGCKAFSYFSFVNTCALHYFTLFMHELGHASLAKAFLKKPKISITVNPFLSGNTRYAISYGLTKAGVFFGKERAYLMIAAGGFISSGAVCLLLTALSKALRVTMPQFSKLIQNIGLAQILDDLVYAVLSLSEEEGYDLSDLSYLYYFGNIHPLIPISLLTAATCYSIYSGLQLS